MGKKKSSSASDAAKVSCDWSASAISNRDVNRLRALGLISSSDDDIRLPGAVSRPRPPKGFTVMFVALFRGLSLPAHEFLRSLLFFYGIQLWQLTPNSILHLSIFITVCEAFLGINPHCGLWKKIFYVKRHNDSNSPPTPVVGGIGFVVRKEVNYFDYPMKESVQGWRNKWFYLRDPSVSGRRSNLPPFEDVLIAQPKKSWRNALSPEEKAIADRLFDQVVILKNTGGLTMCGTEASVVAQCYPPTPESGVEPEDDDDDSEETEDVQHVLEDSDVQEDEAAEDDAFIRSRRHKQINEDFITTAESSPSGQDNDAIGTAPPSPAKKSSTGFFAAEDDLDLSDDDVPLAKRAKLSFERTASARGANPSPAKSMPPSRTTVEKIPMSKVIPSIDAPTSSAARDHLRKTVKTSADQVLEANRLASDAKNENVLLKEVLKKLRRHMKDEQDAKREAAAATDKKEGVLRESITNLLGALSRLYSMIFPKVKQDKTLGEMADAFLVDSSEPVEVLKCRSRLFGAVLTFQLLMGHGMGSELEKLSKALPVDDGNHLIDLEPFKRSAVTCANQLLKLVDEAKTKSAPEAAPGSSSALP
ncbi:hypothetical protein QYE76_064027 [Lolium multiflorum]|uniref:Transposase (putative) gypsy type domain-containing protein n=1 Tax=Lolium multiflorum TaxID=4521 RepID=A0AAD8S646_LOLMU|nr:hypothetical protein QYE76_064027 [Lolium multiflorum]